MKVITCQPEFGVIFGRAELSAFMIDGIPCLQNPGKFIFEIALIVTPGLSRDIIPGTKKEVLLQVRNLGCSRFSIFVPAELLSSPLFLKIKLEMD